MAITRVKLIFIISVFVLMTVMSLHVKAAGKVATVLAKRGEVKILTGASVREAVRKSTLIEFDTLKTDRHSQASIKFNDGTITTIGSDSELLIKEYKWSDGEQSPTVELELVSGVFRTVTGLATKVANPNFSVATPMGSIGIRGTDFWGGFLDEGVLDVLFVGGEHEISIKNEFGTVVLTEPGQGTTIKPGEAPSAAKVWPQEKVQRAVNATNLNQESTNTKPADNCNCPCDKK